jgi:GR25 family glycosyltransferase involved in LPS biosynthesis
VYIINLASREDRRKEMRDQLKRIGVDMLKSNVEFFEATRPDSPGQFPSIGARGCFHSHLNVLQDAEEKNYSSILILEDDLNFSKDFPRRYESMFTELQGQPWAFFYGGYRIGVDVELHSEGCVLIQPTDAVGCAHFLAFRTPAISIAAEQLRTMSQRAAGDALGGPMHVDGAYCWVRQENPELSTFLANPEMGFQRSSRSDIYGSRWFDEVPVLSKVASELRKIRNK